MNKLVVLDASAILALIQEEPGAEVIKPLLKNSIMSSVNFAESLTTLHKAGIEVDEAYEYLSVMLHEVIHFDLEQAKEVTKLYPKAKQKGLSLGDRACLALGLKLKVPVYTADKAWKEIELPIPIHLIR